MKWKMLNVPLGASAPFGTFSKNEAALAAGLIAGGAALASGVGSLINQANTNKANLQATRETNAQNKELFERSLAWQEDMWNKSNEYNDPSNQVDRLLKAGINPAYVLGNGSMAEASPMSSGSVPQMNVPQIQPLDYSHIGSAVANGVNTYMNARMNQAQSGLLEAQQNKTQNESMQISQSMPYYVQHLQNLAKSEGWKGDIARTELSYLQAVNGQRISREFGNNRLLERQIKQADEQYLGYQLQNQLAKVQLSYADKLNEAQLNHYYAAVAELKAEVSLTMARRDLTMEQKLTEIENRSGVIIDNQMKGIDKEIKDRTKNITIGLAKEELYKQEDERYFRPFDYNYRSKGKFGQYYPDPSGEYGAYDLYQRNKKRDRFR